MCDSSRMKRCDVRRRGDDLKRLLYVANSLVDEPVGSEETHDGVWPIIFNTVLLATIDESSNTQRLVTGAKNLDTHRWTNVLSINAAVHPKVDARESA